MILEEIAARTYVRVEELKKRRDVLSLRREAEEMGSNTEFPFKGALAAEGMSFICEVKKASPSKGIIVEEFPYLSIAKEYKEAGAAAISVLTEPHYFMGRDSYLQQIAEEVEIPVLRKDFTIDEYQIFEAKVIGASAILLICALLDVGRLKEYLEIAHSLGLSALVEAHTEEEVDAALHSGAGIIGVNNRNLKTFEVDITTSSRLRRMVPEGILFVSESGIKTAYDVEILRRNKADAVLIGETFMRSADKKRQLAILRGEED
ncbi:MAG: indole-3-glycerol phosphate synthase TrpC [Clostridiales bacterium]|nr:indole-3-glycerol phosphate synthase TrpC [Clostridiales bacterium]